MEARTDWSWARWLDAEDEEFREVFLAAKTGPVELLDKLALWPARLAAGREGEFRRVGEAYIHVSAVLGEGCRIEGPAYIGPGARLGFGAYIRGPVLMGREAGLGHCSELKQSLILYGVEIPHFNYVGDSVLGEYSHLGAGAVLSNVRQDGKEVRLQLPEGFWPQTRRKFGAVLGAGVEVGCQAVLAPGTSVGRGSRIYPLSFVRAAVPERSLVKGTGRAPEALRVTE